MVFLCAAIAPLACAGRVLFVAGDAGNSGDGLTWDAPFERLQDAITVAREGDEIWVKAGTYFPSPTDATMSFALKSDVAIFGGFAGDENARDQRDWRVHITILSGDIGHDDQINPHVLRGSNSGHIVACGAVTPTAVLDGLTIAYGGTGPIGTPATSELMRGSGLYCLDGAPTIRNCTFLGNTAQDKSGGGAFIFEGHPTFLNCRFDANKAQRARGGAIATTGTASMELVDCVFFNNHSTSGNLGASGGAVFHDGAGTLTVLQCQFEANSALPSHTDPFLLGTGGGLAVTDGLVLLQDCIFKANQANAGGGVATDVFSVLLNSLIIDNTAIDLLTLPEGIASTGGGVVSTSPSIFIVNCTITGNHSFHTAGVHATGGSCDLRNSVIWGNASRDARLSGSWQEQINGSFTLSHNCIEALFEPGGVDGVTLEASQTPGCIALDPLFRNVAMGDLRLSRRSPCIDAGDKTLTPGFVDQDLDGEPRLIAAGNRTAQIDMGCYERVPVMGCFEIGDANGSGHVGLGDLNFILAQFGMQGLDLEADANDDHAVNLDDLNIMMANWGSPCASPSGDHRTYETRERADGQRAGTADRLLP